MTNKARLLSRIHGIAPDGTVWATEGGKSRPVFNVRRLDPEYASLLQAAPMMFTAIYRVLPGLETVGVVLDANGLGQYVPPLMELEAGLHTALEVACGNLRKFIE